MNWNGKELLGEFLPSVISYSPEATIYVADNASTDHSVIFVKENFPQVEIIQNIQNGGYAKGYNDALSQLSEDIFILLNSDVEVTKNWLPPLISCFENQPETAAVQPKILDYRRRNYFEYAGAAGGFLDRLAFPYCRGRIFEDLEEDLGQYDDEIPIFWASGACLGIRKKAFYEVGKLDETYFAHQEEIDLCWRLQNLGYTIKYVGKSKVFHIGGATLHSENPKKTFYNFRNSLFNLVKNDGGKFHFLLILLRMKLDGIAAVRFLLKGKPKHFWAVLKAHFSFYKSLPYLLRQRRLFAKKGNRSKTFSIVFAYYILRKKTFSKLKKQP